MIWQLKFLIEHVRSVQASRDGTHWFPARPHAGPFTWRLRAAWLVLTGKADAVVWGDDQ